MNYINFHKFNFSSLESILKNGILLMHSISIVCKCTNFHGVIFHQKDGKLTDQRLSSLFCLLL